MGCPEPSEARSGLRAEVITVGTELVQGLITDTNSAWISTRLASIGVPVDYHTSVADDLEHLEQAVKLAASRSGVVIVAGGLGPTADDITREAIARAAGRPLVLHQPSLDYISGLFASWGHEMAENNRSQAFLPEGAEVIPNGSGTAPGFALEIDRARVLVFPGPPHELHTMMDEFGLPYLKKLRTSPQVLRVRLIHCFGPGESQIDQEIRHLMPANRNPNVGLLVSNYVITVKIAGHAPTEVEVDALIAETEREVRDLLGEVIFGTDDETMPVAVARELMKRNLTIALAESCTGGLIAGMLTEVSGISRSFLAGVVSYSDEAKRGILGVPAELLEKHGAVSEAVVRAMAQGVRELTGADLALSVTGIAGPTGGTPEKPLGLVYIALVDAGEAEVRRCNFHGSRERIRVRTALTALDMVRRRAMSLPV